MFTDSKPLIALMMESFEAVSVSQTLVISIRLHGETLQKTIIFQGDEST